MASVEVDPQTLDAIRRVARARGSSEAEVVEAAVRSFALLSAFEAAARHNGLSDEEAMRIANDELHAMRRERDAADPPTR